MSPCGPSQMIAQSRFQLGSNASGSATLVKPWTRRSASLKSRSSASLITDPIRAPVSRSASLGSMRRSEMLHRAEQANHLVPFLIGRQAGQLPQAVENRLAEGQLFHRFGVHALRLHAVCLPEPEQPLRDRKRFPLGVEPVPVGLDVVRRRDDSRRPGRERKTSIRSSTELRARSRSEQQRAGLVPGLQPLERLPDQPGIAGDLRRAVLLPLGMDHRFVGGHHEQQVFLLRRAEPILDRRRLPCSAPGSSGAGRIHPPSRSRSARNRADARPLRPPRQTSRAARAVGLAGSRPTPGAYGFPACFLACNTAWPA